MPHHFGTRPFAGTATSRRHQEHATVAGRTFCPRPDPIVTVAAAVAALLPVAIFSRSRPSPPLCLIAPATFGPTRYRCSLLCQRLDPS